MKNKLAMVFLVLCSSPVWAQFRLKGRVVDEDQRPIGKAVEVFVNREVYAVDENGLFTVPNLVARMSELVVFSYEYRTLRVRLNLKSDTVATFTLHRLQGELSEVEVRSKREENFALKRLKPIEGTAIYAGKKSEVVLVDQLVANLAANNARQIYGQIVGLNIYESNDGGLQLGIGGRGLNPNRTENFNTRQNGYDISADVLGYPESYYTPPAEALQEVQVIRGAASLQYGSQFGGLVNFKLREPEPHKKISFITRQTGGSFGLFTSFNSLSGTIRKFSYYTYFNYKRSDGYRQNSNFDSKNAFMLLRYKFSPKTEASFELSRLDYLAKQAGGLTDGMFRENPRQSNRTRNWFEVGWRLYSFRLNHAVTKDTDLSINAFGLNATRNALGFRGNPSSLNGNPISDLDEKATDGNYIFPRDLMKGTFKNWGLESRILHKYRFAKQPAAVLVGIKLYKARNTALQGAGSDAHDADFRVFNEQYPNYPNRSDFIFPNLNASLFGEHIFNVGKRLSVTPGLRIEFIKTASQGIYNQVNFDNAGNPISNREFEDNRLLKRSFAIFGIGVDYKLKDGANCYVNVSQNYRSVTFSDIRTVSPTFKIDPNIRDEKGFTADFGLKGNAKQKVSFDVGGFGLLYDNRIGIILDDRANRVRKNIGRAFIYGFESLIDWNIANTFFPEKYQTRLNVFTNLALTSSRYLASEERNVTGKKVEFIPVLNLKTGIRFGHKNLYLSCQSTYLSRQFTDVQNSRVPEDGDARNGIIGEIPAYHIFDISMSYTFKICKFETGLNNALNQVYFTRRATGYPGPGIIPSDGRSFYVTLQVKL